VRTAKKRASTGHKTKRPSAGVSTKITKEGKYTVITMRYDSGAVGERSATTGRFVRESTQDKRPSTTVRESIPLPGKVTHRRSDRSKEDAELHNAVASASAKSIARRA
jgi:hypothetical protein